MLPGPRRPRRRRGSQDTARRRRSWGRAAEQRGSGSRLSPGDSHTCHTARPVRRAGAGGGTRRGGPGPSAPRGSVTAACPSRLWVAAADPSRSAERTSLPVPALRRPRPGPAGHAGHAGGVCVGRGGRLAGEAVFPLTARWLWESFVLVFRAFLFSKTLHGPRGNTSLLGLRSRTESCGLSLPLKSRGNRRHQGLGVLRPPRESWAPFWARSHPSFIRPLHTRFRARDDQGPFQAQSCDGDHRNQSPSSRREHAPTAAPVRLKYVSHHILLRRRSLRKAASGPAGSPLPPPRVALPASSSPTPLGNLRAA